MLAPSSTRQSVSRLAPGGGAALGNSTLVVRSRAPGLRRALGLVLIGGLCAAAVTFYQEGPELPRSGPEAATSTQLPTASSLAQSSSAEGPSASSSTSAAKQTARRRSQSQAKLPKGPGTSEPGILLMASPLSDGTFDIAEMVLLPVATSSIRLAPPKLTLAGSRFAKSKPVATQVQVSAANQPAMVPNGRVSRGMDIGLLEPAKRIELRYNLRGITVHSVPSPAGRALTAIAPLTGVPTSLPVAMMVTGNTVLNIQCPAVRRVQDQACSTGRPPRLHVKPKLSWSNAVFVVQFDLPRPQ
jgi:hypothetical protein